MAKKAIFGVSIVAVVLLVSVIGLAAVEKKEDEGGGGEIVVSRQGGGGAAEIGEKSKRRGRAGGYDKWLEELTEAYEENDRGKMGELLVDMKSRREKRRQGRRGRGSEKVAIKSHWVSNKAEREVKIVGVIEDLYKNQREGMMNVPPEDGKVLKLLVEALGAKRVVEIGTSNGYSGLWICLALQSTGGELITHEIDAGRARLARENFRRAGVEKMVRVVEGDAHVTIAKLRKKIDVVFIDAERSGYVDYLDKLLPLVRPGGLILAHNTNSGEVGMQNYIKAVTSRPELETIFLHKEGRGIGVTLKRR